VLIGPVQLKQVPPADLGISPSRRWGLGIWPASLMLASEWTIGQPCGDMIPTAAHLNFPLFPGGRGRAL